MKKYIPIYLYGAIIIFEGLFLLFSGINSLKFVTLTTGITLTLGAIVAFIAAFSRQRKQVQFAYHEMHALAMLVYGVSVLLFCNTFEQLISFTAFLFIFYAFSEIIFCNWLYNFGLKVLYKIILVRFILGLLIGVGTVLAMSMTVFTLEGFGALFILVGINILLYVPIIKEGTFSEVS